jgi:hypothetical protein
MCSAGFIGAAEYLPTVPIGFILCRSRILSTMSMNGLSSGRKLQLTKAVASGGNWSVIVCLC